MAPKKESKIETLGFINPRILNADGEVLHKSNRGYAITNSERFPTTKFDKMLLALAEKHDGEVTINMQCTIRLNKSDDTPLDFTDIPVVAAQ